MVYFNVSAIQIPTEFLTATKLNHLAQFLNQVFTILVSFRLNLKVMVLKPTENRARRQSNLKSTLTATLVPNRRQKRVEHVSEFFRKAS